jgi:hypothetical protein
MTSKFFIIHSLFAAKISLDKSISYDIIFTMVSLHKNYKKNSSGIGKFLTSRFLNTIDPTHS